MTPAELDSRSRSVVLIDDAEDVRDLVSLVLERSGDFEVLAVASDGAQGVVAVTAHSPDVALLDIAMPVMDGLEALTLIREACPSTAVVMLSGFGDASGAPRRAMELGALGYLAKGGSLLALPSQLLAILGT